MKIIISLLIIGSVSLSWARDGQEGHGGDIVVAMFYGIAKATLNCMQLNPSSWSGSPILYNDLNYVIEHTIVSSRSEPVYLNGEEVDAINYPDVEAPRIILNRGRWFESTYPNSYRAVLVLHEYLSIAGYDDQHYDISFPLAQKNSVCIKQQVSL